MFSVWGEVEHSSWQGGFGAAAQSAYGSRSSLRPKRFDTELFVSFYSFSLIRASTLAEHCGVHALLMPCSDIFAIIHWWGWSRMEGVAFSAGTWQGCELWNYPSRVLRYKILHWPATSRRSKGSAINGERRCDRPPWRNANTRCTKTREWKGCWFIPKSTVISTLLHFCPGLCRVHP